MKPKHPRRKKNKTRLDPFHKQNAEFKFLREETTEEKFMKIEISEVEKKNLWRVFDILCGERIFAEEESKWFRGSDIRKVLRKLGIRSLPQHKIDIMVWVRLIRKWMRI